MDLKETIDKYEDNDILYSGVFNTKTTDFLVEAYIIVDDPNNDLNVSLLLKVTMKKDIALT